jgi:hypothetical protein
VNASFQRLGSGCTYEGQTPIHSQALLGLESLTLLLVFRLEQVSDFAAGFSSMLAQTQELANLT